MSNQVTKVFSDMSDEELVMVIQEMKEDGPQGIVRMDGIVREKCKMVQEITSGNAYEHMMTVQFSILQEAAYRFTPKKMENMIEKCRCGSDPESLHICPYQQDINGDTETLCNCCSECEHQCMMDI